MLAGTEGLCWGMSVLKKMSMCSNKSIMFPVFVHSHGTKSSYKKNCGLYVFNKDLKFMFSKALNN